MTMSRVMGAKCSDSWMPTDIDCPIRLTFLMSRSVQRMIIYSKVVDRKGQSNFVVVVALFDTIDVPIHLKP